MLLRFSQWSSWLLGALPLMMVVLLSGYSSAKTPPQPFIKYCNNRTNTSDDIILYYVERANPNVTACTRYAWSTVGYPTLFISQDRSSCKCKYELDEDEYTSNQALGSVNITGTDSYFSLAIVFKSLIEFLVDSKNAEAYSKFNASEMCNELNNNPNYTDINPFELWSHDLNSTLNWTLSGDQLVGTSTVESNLTFTINTTEPGNEAISTHFPEAIGLERLGFFPKPQISENATLIDLVIQNFTFTLTGSDDDDDDDDTKASRLALEVIIIHGAQVNNGSSTLDEYLDDEYTPSIFSSWSYNVSGKDTQEFEDMGGYVHWKPISYQDGSRKSTISQQVNVVVAGDSQECILESIPKGLARALFGEQVDSLRVSNITRWFVVFGTEGDDDFFSPEYSTWTLVVGYGEVPTDTLSATVIIVIIVGLGIPGALVILGGIYVFIRKKPWQNASRLLAKARGREGYTSLT